MPILIVLNHKMLPEDSGDLFSATYPLECPTKLAFQVRGGGLSIGTILASQEAVNSILIAAEDNF